MPSISLSVHTESDHVRFRAELNAIRPSIPSYLPLSHKAGYLDFFFRQVFANDDEMCVLLIGIIQRYHHLRTDCDGAFYDDLPLFLLAVSGLYESLLAHSAKFSSGIAMPLFPPRDPSHTIRLKQLQQDARKLREMTAGWNQSIRDIELADYVEVRCFFFYYFF